METKRHIKMDGLSDNYSITADGRVYSRIKKRYLKGSRNGSGYIYYYLKGPNGSKWYFAHRLVYLTYVGPIQNEINHIDRNKLNNHHSNLEDITHQENIRKARGLKSWDSGRKKGWAMPDDVKAKIGAANGRGVDIIGIDGEVVTNASSGMKAAEWLGVSYSTMQRVLRKRVYHEFPKGYYRLQRI